MRKPKAVKFFVFNNQRWYESHPLRHPSLALANRGASYGWQAMRRLSTVARSVKVDATRLRLVASGHESPASVRTFTDPSFGLAGEPQTREDGDRAAILVVAYQLQSTSLTSALDQYHRHATRVIQSPPAFTHRLPARRMRRFSGGRYSFSSERVSQTERQCKSAREADTAVGTTDRVVASDGFKCCIWRVDERGIGHWSAEVVVNATGARLPRLSAMVLTPDGTETLGAATLKMLNEDS